MVSAFQERQPPNVLQRLTPPEQSEKRIRELEQHIKLLRLTAGIPANTPAQQRAVYETQTHEIGSVWRIWGNHIQAQWTAGLGVRTGEVIASVETHIGNPMMRDLQLRLKAVQTEGNKGERMGIV